MPGKKPRSLFAHSLSALAAAALALCAVFAVAAVFLVRDVYDGTNKRALAGTAGALAAALPADALPVDTAAWARTVGKASGVRITIVAPDGVVIAHTLAAPSAMENHLSRPEIARALAGSPASATRKSATVGMVQHYAATPLRDQSGAISGVLRVSADLPDLHAKLVPTYFTLAGIFLLAAAGALLAAARFSRNLADPISRVAHAATQAARRPELLPASLPKSGPFEIQALGEAVGTMAGQLASRAEEALEKGREMTAILDGMTEAVLALDPDLHIRLFNKAAGALFDLPDTGSGTLGVSMSLLEATRSTSLEESARRTLASAPAEAGAPETELSIVRQGRERTYKVHIAAYGSPPGQGIVIVLEDLTALKHLERIRRDFVANVSHELRTPIQLVKGFAEALGSDGIENPDQARRFASIIERNARRMENLIEDLLTLAKIEQGERSGIEMSEEPIRPILDEAIEAVGGKAASRGIALEVECPGQLTGTVNAGLIVQAVVNLLDNAIKFSKDNSRVSLRAYSAARSITIEVADSGPGIPASELPRLFERFYRVDKARSASLGGTGLGLAIVRHIAVAHHGKAEAESWEGEGSVFRIILPH